MKKILITGANSYIGNSFEKYMEQWPEKYHVDTVDMIDGSWRKMDFSSYDAIYHVAGIAHSDNGKISPDREKLYYAVNTDLAIETAQKAKAEGVKQFIFMSSASVYGESSPVGKLRMITKDTPVSPANCYGDSKVQAERGIWPLNDDNFRVVILRPPMIYGPGSKGNYPTLSKLAKKLPVFPRVMNQRSMLFVGNLLEFVKLMIENEEQGFFWPQNAEYTNTTHLVELIARANGKNMVVIPGLTWVLRILSHVTGLVNKAFGSLSYEMNMSEYKDEYQKFDLVESIMITENQKVD